MLDPTIYRCRDYPWRLMLTLEGAGADLVVASNVDGKAIAHYPMSYLSQKFATHPSGSIFAAASQSRLAFFRLEDAPEAPSGEAIFAEAMAAREQADDAWRCGRTEDALAAVEQAFALYVGVPHDDRYRACLELMRTLRGRAEMLSVLNRSEEAIASADEALGFGRVMANEEAYHEEVANLCFAQSLRLNAANRCEESLAVNTEALQLMRQAAERDPATHAQAFASMIYHQGHRLLRLTRNENALEFLDEAEPLLRRAAARSSNHFADLTNCLNCKVYALQELRRDAEALTASEEALDLSRRLFAGDQEQYSVLWPALKAHRTALQRSGFPKEAGVIEAEMVKLCHDMHARGVAALSGQAVAQLGVLGDDMLAAGQWEQALALQSEIVAMLRDRPTENRLALAACLLARGDILGQHDRDEEAIAPLSESIDLYRQHFSQNWEEGRGHVAHGLYRLCKRLSASGRDGHTAAAAEEAVGYYRELLTVDPDTSQLRLCECLNYVAWGRFKSGPLEDALVPAEEAVGFGRELIARDRVAFAHLVANVLDTQGQIERALGFRSEAIACFQEALALLDAEALSASSLNAALKEDIAKQLASTVE